MKIRTDFVSNSSSSSFIIMADKKYSDEKVARDFVDFAFNTYNLADWDTYSEVRLKSLSYYFDMDKDKFPNIYSKLAYIKEEYDRDKEYLGCDEDTLKGMQEKLLELFSVDPNKRLPNIILYTWEDHPDLVCTAKLTKDEVIGIVKLLESDLTKCNELLVRVNDISEVEYNNLKSELNSKFDFNTETFPEITEPENYLMYFSRSECIEDLNRRVNYLTRDIDRWNKALNNLKDLDKLNVYLIQVSYEGDGEDPDSLYSYTAYRNYHKYSDGNYCFKIFEEEYL